MDCSMITSGDDLRLVKFLASDLIVSKFWKFFLKLVFALYTSLVVLHVVYFCKIPEAHFITKNLPLFCWSLFGASSSVLYIYKETFLKDMAELDLWPKDCLGEQLEIKIIKECRQFSRFILWNTFLVIITSIILGLLGVTTYKLWLPYVWFIETFGPHHHIAYSLLYIVDLMFIYSMVAIPYQFLYFTQHIINQCYMLEEYLNTIESENNVYDQNVIHKKLIFCIRRHIYLHGVISRKRQEIKVFIPFFTVGTCTLGIGIMVYLYNTISSAEGYISAVIFTLLFINLFFGFMRMGQVLQDANGRLYQSLVKTKWYAWDARNKKLLLIFLPFLLRPFKMEFTRSMAINYDLGVKMVKMMYSVTAMFVRSKYKTC